MCIHIMFHLSVKLGGRLADLTAVKLLLWGAKRKRTVRERLKLIPHIRSLWRTYWACLTRICLSASRLSSALEEFFIYIQTQQQTDSTPCLPITHTHTHPEAIRCSVKIARITALTHELKRAYGFHLFHLRARYSAIGKKMSREEKWPIVDDRPTYSLVH